MAGMQRDLKTAQRIGAVVQGKVAAHDLAGVRAASAGRGAGSRTGGAAGHDVASVHQARYGVGKLLRQEREKVQAGVAEGEEECHG
jgi:hypothetical protein